MDRLHQWKLEFELEALEDVKELPEETRFTQEEYLAKFRAGEIKAHISGNPVLDTAYEQYLAEKEEIRGYGMARRLGFATQGEPACMALWPADRACEVMAERGCVACYRTLFRALIVL